MDKNKSDVSTEDDVGEDDIARYLVPSCFVLGLFIPLLSEIKLCGRLLDLEAAPFASCEVSRDVVWV